ncbi:MAG: hypothetical protein ACI8QC_004297 [Planctomycetota bacterium]|jgi:hypothetical protein
MTSKHIAAAAIIGAVLWGPACSDSDGDGGGNCEALLQVDDGAGMQCDGLGQCLDTPCPCMNGDVPVISSCFNGECAGRNACASACADVGSSFGCPATAETDTQTGTDTSATDTGVASDTGTPTDTQPPSDTGTPADTQPPAKTQSGQPCPITSCRVVGIFPATIDCAQCVGGRCFATSNQSQICTRPCDGGDSCDDFGGSFVCAAGDCVQF